MQEEPSSRPLRPDGAGGPPAGAARVLGSAAAPLRDVALPADVPGRLWLSAMPGRFAPWRQFLAEAQQQQQLSLVLCLAPLEEVAELAPPYHTAVALGRLPFRWLNLPMRNFGLPPELPAFQDGIAQAAQALREGESVLLHCAAGLGRTGSAAACVLKTLGLSTEAALQRVREAGSNPQNARQCGLVERF